MNSRELVRKTLKFEKPERIPRDIWIGPWARIHHPKAVDAIGREFPNDVIRAPRLFTGVSEETIAKYSPGGAYFMPGTMVDDWGCVWENREAGMAGEVKTPALATLKDWKTLRVPEEYLALDVDKINDYCACSGAFVLSSETPSSCVRPWERYQYVRGVENSLMDTFDLPVEMFRVLEKIHAFNCKMLSLWAQTRVDGLFFMDDWGSQKSLLISPDIWRRLFKPMYRDYVNIAHVNGKAAFMHSDGHILDILPDLEEIGVDAINCQVFCMGLDVVARFRGRITFWGDMDRQYLLPFGTPDEVEAGVRNMHAALFQEGGIIAQCDFGVGVKPANVQSAVKTWNSFRVSPHHAPERKPL